MFSHFFQWRKSRIRKANNGWKFGLQQFVLRKIFSFAVVRMRETQSEILTMVRPYWTPSHDLRLSFWMFCQLPLNCLLYVFTVKHFSGAILAFTMKAWQDLAVRFFETCSILFVLEICSVNNGRWAVLFHNSLFFIFGKVFKGYDCTHSDICLLYADS